MIRCGLLLIVLSTPTLRAQDIPAKFLSVREGRAPIVISAPHGGGISIPGVPERKGEGVAKFATVRDGRTTEIAIELADLLDKKLGQAVHLVAANFERKFADVNRPAEGAYESEKARPYYEAYHQALQKAVRKVQTDHGRGLLIDIHGQGADADAIFRGTNNGKTVRNLVAKFGNDSVVGPHSLLGFLEAKGHKILPARKDEQKEDPRFSGGFIVQTYGSHREIGIDAIQLELGAKWRATANVKKSAAVIAEAVVDFAGEYLKK